MEGNEAKGGVGEFQVVTKDDVGVLDVKAMELAQALTARRLKEFEALRSVWFTASMEKSPHELASLTDEHVLKVTYDGGNNFLAIHLTKHERNLLRDILGPKE
jgi:hypothetical protein